MQRHAAISPSGKWHYQADGPGGAVPAGERAASVQAGTAEP